MVSIPDRDLSPVCWSSRQHYPSDRDRGGAWRRRICLSNQAALGWLRRGTLATRSLVLPPGLVALKFLPEAVMPPISYRQPVELLNDSATAKFSITAVQSIIDHHWPVRPAVVGHEPHGQVEGMDQFVQRLEFLSRLEWA